MLVVASNLQGRLVESKRHTATVISHLDWMKSFAEIWRDCEIENGDEDAAQT